MTPNRMIVHSEQHDARAPYATSFANTSQKHDTHRQ